MENKPFHVVTPLIRSAELSKLAGRDIYLKLDNIQVRKIANCVLFETWNDIFQPPGSFKIRGIGRTCQVAVDNGAKKLVGSSGGNAGIAMAYAAQKLKVPLSLFIPHSTPKSITDKLQVLYKG